MVCNVNVQAELPSIVREMQAKLKTYTPYVDGRMTPAALSKYNCSAEVKAQWDTPQGSFAGPCCQPK